MKTHYNEVETTIIHIFTSSFFYYHIHHIDMELDTRTQKTIATCEKYYLLSKNKFNTAAVNKSGKVAPLARKLVVF